MDIIRIVCVQQMMEKLLARKKKFYLDFVDLERHLKDCHPRNTSDGSRLGS